MESNTNKNINNGEIGLIYSEQFKRETYFLYNERNGVPFKDLNRLMAENTGSKSGFMLAKQLGLGDRADEILQIFTDYCYKCGSGFEGLTRNDPNYKVAKSSVGPNILEFLPKVLEVAGIKTSLKEFGNKVDLLTMATIVEPEFLDNGVEKLNIEEIKNSLSKTVPIDDYYRELIDGLTLKNEELTEDETKVLNIVIALAQAGYVHTQLPRALAESQSRIRTPVFDTNYGMRRNVFCEINGEVANYDETTTKTDRTLRVLFEIFKDWQQVEELF